MSDTKYLYFELEFINCYMEDCEAIAEDLDEVREMLQSVEIQLDDPDANAEVRIKGIGLTRAAFENYKDELKNG